MNRRAAELLAAGFFIGMGVGIAIGQAEAAHASTEQADPFGPFNCSSFIAPPNSAGQQSTINNIYCSAPGQQGPPQHIFCYTNQFGTNCNG